VANLAQITRTLNIDQKTGAANKSGDEYMDKIWLKHYPVGRPAEINPDQYASLVDLLHQCCALFGDSPAFTNFGKTISYNQLEVLTRNFAAWLQNVAQLKRGDRIALMMPNLLQYPVAMFGAMRAGLTIVNTNPLYTGTELQHQLQDSGAVAIVILENFAHVLQEVIKDTSVQTIVVTGVGDLLGFPKQAVVNFVLRHVRKQVPAFDLPNAVRFNAALRSGKYLSLDEVPLTHEDVAFLQYTGGTTGVAKAAVLTHRNMVANCIQASSCIGMWDLRDRIVITALPLYHIFSLTVNCFVFMRLGTHNVLITNPRDFPGFVKELHKYPMAAITAVNTLFNALLHTPGFESVDFSRLKVSLGGGMAVQPSVAEQWKKVTGCVVAQGWGLTESSPVGCVTPLDTDFDGSIGMPVPSTELTIRDDDGKELPLGESGEICLRGPQVMREYWRRPDETAKVMLPDGWLRSGDIGRMDERGFVFIEDRKKDMIMVSGFKVFPNEVEAVIAAHPGVLEVAAVAQPDERAGEVVAVFIVRKDPTLTAEQIIEHCRKEMTGYKLPKHVYFRDELPKTNVGKILRRALRDELVNAK
jgi:long-chain acyl-CoA synthetase